MRFFFFNAVLYDICDCFFMSSFLNTACFLLSSLSIYHYFNQVSIWLIWTPVCNHMQISSVQTTKTNKEHNTFYTLPHKDMYQLSNMRTHQRLKNWQLLLPCLVSRTTCSWLRVISTYYVSVCGTFELCWSAKCYFCVLAC